MFGFQIVATSTILGALEAMEQRIMAALDNLTDEVAQNKTVMQSAVALLDGLNQKLKDAIASGDPTKIQALSDELDSNTSALADAVVRNTPVEGQP